MRRKADICHYAFRAVPIDESLLQWLSKAGLTLLWHPTIKPLPVLLLAAPSMTVAGKLLQPPDVFSGEEHQRFLAAVQNLIAVSNGIEPSCRMPPSDLSAATSDASLIR